MFQPERALAAINMIIQALRRGVFNWTPSERQNLADDLELLEADIRAVVKRRREARKAIQQEEIAELMREEMRRK
jgi:hypothetical protein